jgi:ferrous iron transport protein B
LLQYRHLDTLLEDVLGGKPSGARTRDSIDALLLHRVWGSVMFLGVMAVVFQSLYAWAGPLMDGIEAGTAGLQELVGPLLAATPTLQSRAVDGVIAGVGGVIVFLPQIPILFF